MLSEIELKITLRFIFGGGAVALSAIIAKLVGGRFGGIFAAFPAVYLSAVTAVGLSLPKGIDTKATLEVSKGALIGMLANIFCAIYAAYFTPKYGWKKGLTLSIIIWFCIASAVYGLVFYLGLVR